MVSLYIGIANRYKLLSESRLESEGEHLQTCIWGYWAFCRQIRMKLRSKDIKSRCGCIKGGICKGRWETGWMGPRPLPRTGQTSSRRSRRDLIYFCKYTPTTEKEKGRRTSHLPSTRLTGNRPELLPTHLKKKKKRFLKKLYEETSLIKIG